MPRCAQAFYSDKKKQYDISKVPDIYDSAKYDAIHNSELGLTLEPLYHVSPLGFWSCIVCGLLRLANAGLRVQAAIALEAKAMDTADSHCCEAWCPCRQQYQWV